MCGIAGLLNLSGRTSAEDLKDRVIRMTNRMLHRGPDADGHWQDPQNRCHLGHRRLSILDLSELGRQPMLDASGRYAITYNGEIYNFLELRRSLEQQGHRFKSRCDTEVLLSGYAQWGERMFAMLDGMFALAIFDMETGRLTLARDRAGEKPLYYRQTADLLGFASELSAIEVGMPEDLALSEDGLAQYFMLRYVPAPGTIYEGVAKLEPGMIMTVEPDGRVAHKRFYTFELDPEFSSGDNRFNAICGETEASLIQSLRGRLNSDVPLGVFLSAGIDSTLSAALLTKQLKVAVKSFTIGFEGDAKSEHHDARKFAQALGTEHSEYVFSASDFETVGRQIGTKLDEPNGDRSCVPTYLLSKFTRESVTVAISGDGGDEVFCGYSRYFGFADKVKGDLHQAPRQAIDLYFKHFLPVYAGEAVASALPQGFAAFKRMLDRYIPLFQFPGRSAVQALRQLDFLTYMPGAVLPKVDRMSMQHSLETRSPFYEPRVLEIGRRLATNLCRDKDVGKLVLRAILKRYVPVELTMLPKRGFGMPPSVFINNAEAISAELNVARERLSATRFFGDRPDALAQLAKFAGGNINAAWAFIVLGQWSTARSVRV